MSRCSCNGSASCSCAITAGDGINVRGNGSLSSPYVIENSAVVERYLNTLDTPTLDLTIEGGGTPGNPFVLSGEPTLAVTDLTDVSDLEGPQNGDTLVWVVDHFEFQAPPSGGGGGGSPVITTGAGITGAGTGQSPLAAAVSGVWGSGSMTGFPTDKTLGVPIFTDNAGLLRARPTPIVRYAVNPVATWGAGWGVGTGTMLWYQYESWVYFRFVATRTGASISFGTADDYDIANQQIAVLKTDLPAPLPGDWPVTVGTLGGMFGAYIGSGRDINLTSGPPNGRLVTGKSWALNGMYMANTGVVL